MRLSDGRDSLRDRLGSWRHVRRRRLDHRLWLNRLGSHLDDRLWLNRLWRGRGLSHGLRRRLGGLRAWNARGRSNRLRARARDSGGRSDACDSWCWLGGGWALDHFGELVDQAERSRDGLEGIRHGGVRGGLALQLRESTTNVTQRGLGVWT